jgi:hypothetical protein
MGIISMVNEKGQRKSGLQPISNAGIHLEKLTTILKMSSTTRLPERLKIIVKFPRTTRLPE